MSYLVEVFGDWKTYKAARAHAAELNGISVEEFIEAANVPLSLLQALPGYNEGESIAGYAASTAIDEPKAIGRCAVHNLLSEPSLLLPDASVVYIGRGNKRQQLSASPLVNLSRMKGDSQAERDRVCNEDLQRLITVLKVQKGKTWDELKRLALRVRGGEDIRLICYCAPLRCHGEAIAYAINALAAKTKASEIIENLRAIKPATQKNLLGDRL